MPSTAGSSSRQQSIPPSPVVPYGTSRKTRIIRIVTIEKINRRSVSTQVEELLTNINRRPLKPREHTFRRNASGVLGRPRQARTSIQPAPEISLRVDPPGSVGPNGHDHPTVELFVRFLQLRRALIPVCPHRPGRRSAIGLCLPRPASAPPVPAASGPSVGSPISPRLSATGRLELPRIRYSVRGAMIRAAGSAEFDPASGAKIRSALKRRAPENRGGQSDVVECGTPARGRSRNRPRVATYDRRILNLAANHDHYWYRPRIIG